MDEDLLLTASQMSGKVRLLPNALHPCPSAIPSMAGSVRAIGMHRPLDPKCLFTLLADIECLAGQILTFPNVIHVLRTSHIRQKRTALLGTRFRPKRLCVRRTASV